MKAPTKLEEYLQARSEHDRLKKQANDAYARMRAVENALVAEMQDADMRQFTTLDGTKIHLRRYQTCSVTKENEGDVREWLRATFGDDLLYEKRTLNKQAVVDEVKESLEKGNLSEIDLPDFLNWRESTGAVVTLAKESV